MSEWVSAGKVRMTPKGTYNFNMAYNILDLVSNSDKSAFYMAKQDVPANTALADTEYWENIINTNGASNLVVSEYDDLMFPITAGQICSYKDDIYIAKQDIDEFEYWTIAHWTRITTGEETNKLKTALKPTWTLGYTLSRNSAMDVVRNSQISKAFSSTILCSEGDVIINESEHWDVTGTYPTNFGLVVLDKNRKAITDNVTLLWSQGVTSYTFPQNSYYFKLTFGFNNNTETITQSYIDELFSAYIIRKKVDDIYNGVKIRNLNDVTWNKEYAVNPVTGNIYRNANWASGNTQMAATSDMIDCSPGDIIMNDSPILWNYNGEDFNYVCEAYFYSRGLYTSMISLGPLTTSCVVPDDVDSLRIKWGRYFNVSRTTDQPISDEELSLINITILCNGQDEDTILQRSADREFERDLTNVAMSYYNVSQTNAFTYGSNGNFKYPTAGMQINCSSGTLSVIGGIPYHLSRYVNQSNGFFAGGYGFDFYLYGKSLIANENAEDEDAEVVAVHEEITKSTENTYTIQELQNMSYNDFYATEAYRNTWMMLNALYRWGKTIDLYDGNYIGNVANPRFKYLLPGDLVFYGTCESRSQFGSLLDNPDLSVKEGTIRYWDTTNEQFISWLEGINERKSLTPTLCLNGAGKTFNGKEYKCFFIINHVDVVLSRKNDGIYVWDAGGSSTGKPISVHTLLYSSGNENRQFMIAARVPRQFSIN